MTRAEETIFALSSGLGRAGVAVVRLSGSRALGVAKKMCNISELEKRYVKLIMLMNPETGEPIDDGLVVFFPGPKSFTGEDVIEFQVHGSRAVLDELFVVLGSFEGVRPADAGEFTRRAFENGKMDLTEVEGLADLLAAETRVQKAQALAQARGALGQLFDEWRSHLVKASALVAADIDFADEDLPDDLWRDAEPLIRRVYEEIGTHLADGHRGERLRDGYRVAILGAPNVGKSSLINLLARRDVAIVSDEPGTTRDVVEVHLDLGGFPVVVMDTAGLREGAGTVEAEGIRRAKLSAETADLRIWMADARDYPDPGPACADRQAKDLLLWNKVDQASGAVNPAEPGGDPGEILRISVKKEEGIGAFLSRLSERVAADLENPRVGEGQELPGLTRARHREGLTACREFLGNLLQRTGGPTGFDSDLMAEDLRLATRALGRLTGQVDVEEILDHVFRDFCIGK